MCQVFLCVMLKIKQKNKVTRGGTIVERVAREGRCKEQVQRPERSKE